MIGGGEVIVVLVVACGLIRPKDLPLLVREVRSVYGILGAWLGSCIKDVERLADNVEMEPFEDLGDCGSRPTEHCAASSEGRESSP